MARIPTQWTPASSKPATTWAESSEPSTLWTNISNNKPTSQWTPTTKTSTGWYAMNNGSLPYPYDTSYKQYDDATYDYDGYPVEASPTVWTVTS